MVGRASGLAGDRRCPHRSAPVTLWLTVEAFLAGMSDTKRFLLAAGGSLLFSLACLAAALQPSDIACGRTALDCPTRL